MISISEKSQKAKFVYMNYPDISIGLLDCKTKRLSINSGILQLNYSIDDLNENMIKFAFGEEMGTGIIKLCDLILKGKTLNNLLITSLKIKE